MIPRLVGLSCSAFLGCANPPAESRPSTESESESGSESADSAESTHPSLDSSDSGDGAASTSDSSTTTEGPDPTDTDSTTGAPPVDMGPPPPDPNLEIPPLDEEGCPGLYAQDLFPTFELTISPVIWNMLIAEWADGAFKEALDLEYSPLHPLQQFKYNDIVINDAMIRLRGNPNNWDPGDKMQFHIDFNEVDEEGRFLGLRSLALDAATGNRHMLRDRLALSIMRDMGILAPCANNARLNINGEYYGVFTSLEKLNKNFLDRVFDDPTGDLWKRANWTLKTNQSSSNADRLEDLKDADTPADLEDYLDLEQALQVFAAEAIIPDSDGMWAGGLNYYLYDDPVSEKFLMLPWDLDNTFERFKDLPEGEYPANPDPIVWEKWLTHGRPFYDIALSDPDWFAYYIECIEKQVASGYDVDTLHDRIDTWTDQIEDAVLEDQNKPYSNNAYEDAVDDLNDYVEARAEFLEVWLDCWQAGGFANPEGYCVQY